MIAATAGQRGVVCSGCGAPLPATLYNQTRPGICPKCDTPVEVSVFPALFRSLQTTPAERVMADGEADCYNHPQNKAVVICADCGRFLCSLCDVEIAGKHSCPDCIELGLSQGGRQELITRRTLHDSIALSLSLLPLIMWPITCLTAPVALFYALRHWKSPTSILPRSRFRYLLAIVFSLLQIGGWLTLLVETMA